LLKYEQKYAIISLFTKDKNPMETLTPTTPETGKAVDLSSALATALFNDAPFYMKRHPVQARMADKEEVIITTLADGLEETRHLAHPGDMIITNPGGERYVLSRESFDKQYAPAEVEGMYRSTDRIRAIDNFMHEPVSINAPWGALQYGDADCLFAASVDPTRPQEITAERYIIGREEFNATYMAVPAPASSPSASQTPQLTSAA
jgi:hypothetical protein